MKKATIIIIFLLGCLLTSTAQKPSLELTFTAIDSAAHIQLDSIKIMNRSQGGDTVLYYPDTVLVLDYITGITEGNRISEGLQVFQNYPNPVVESTTISINVPEKGLLRYMVTDKMGRVIIQSEEVFEPGVHSFSYTPGGGEMSFFTAFYGNSRESIKILHSNLHQSSTPQLSYLGGETNSAPSYKAAKAMQGISFSLGDVLLYIGYIDGMETGISDAPTESDTLYFQFATNISCPGIPTVTYEGQVYNTIQIFSQCWLKENLNVGIMIDSLENQSNNNTIEKYCIANSEDSCDFFGGLYQWNEVMSYVDYMGVRGICPQGWHIPSDIEWRILQGTVDTEYGIGDSIWISNIMYMGEDVGLHLKSSSGWAEDGNGFDTYGFNALPTGRRSTDGSFGLAGYQRVYGFLWTSSSYSNYNANSRQFAYFSDGIHRQSRDKDWGFGVRCIKD